MKNSDTEYRRGAVMGFTVAEIFMLILFVILLLLALWQVKNRKAIEVCGPRDSVVLDKIHPVEDQLLMTVLDPDKMDFIKRVTKVQDSDSLEEILLALERGVTIRDIDDAARLMSEDEVKAISERAIKLNDDQKRKLENLVSAEEIAEFLDSIGSLSAEDLTEAVKSLREQKEKEEKFATNIQERLGKILAELGGEIKKNGRIVLPEGILFQIGKADVNSEATGILKQVCVEWVKELYSQSQIEEGLEFTEIRIEGHASSTWLGASQEEAFERNQDLSFERAKNVMKLCTLYAKEEAPDAAKWLVGKLVPIGYSSTHIIKDEHGQEDRAKSRRVELSVHNNIRENE